jgi:hypothetical protein
MALVYEDQSTLATTTAFVDRVRIALLNYSIAVESEDVDGEGEPTTAEHALRLALARRIVNNPMGYGEILIYSLVADGQLTGASTDANIDTQIGLLYTTLATLS